MKRYMFQCFQNYKLLPVCTYIHTSVCTIVPVVDTGKHIFITCVQVSLSYNIYTAVLSYVDKIYYTYYRIQIIYFIKKNRNTPGRNTYRVGVQFDTDTDTCTHVLLDIVTDTDT